MSARHVHSTAGRPARPRLAIVTARLDLDPAVSSRSRTSCPSSSPAPPPTVRPCWRSHPAATSASVGTAEVDLAAVAGQLAAEGADVVVAEGGPSLNGAVSDADLVDELCLTISPRTAGGTSTRLIAGADARRRDYELVSLLTEDD
ncbi:MAG: dihydrofolate reductase family protein, partial [Acidimicrobiales bacterium]|nr:dihydrofolate reductase family protein [Acidimicrobiales bacterium]